jgi:hypothetical protein
MTHMIYKDIRASVAANDVRHALYLEGLFVSPNGIRPQVRDAGTPAS